MSSNFVAITTAIMQQEITIIFGIDISLTVAIILQTSFISFIMMGENTDPCLLI